jgi:hypothetical protein
MLTLVPESVTSAEYIASLIHKKGIIMSTGKPVVFVRRPFAAVLFNRSVALSVVP